MKIKCGKCLESKEESAFSKKKKSKTGYSSKCKACHNDYCREVWYIKNKDKQIKASNNWKKENKYKVLSYTYNTSENTIKELFHNFNNKCGICNKEIIRGNIDHCHISGKLRGILCKKCNLGLGLFFDNKEFLQKAIDYLNKYS